MTDLAKTLEEAAAELLPSVCRQFSVGRLDLFGSAVTSAFDLEESDLDFLVTFRDVPTREYATTYFGLRQALAQIFGRQVDLVTESALVNPFFRRRVEAQRRQLFPAS